MSTTINQDEATEAVDFSSPRPLSAGLLPETLHATVLEGGGGGGGGGGAADAAAGGGIGGSADWAGTSDSDNRVGAHTPSSVGESFTSAVSSFGAHRTSRDNTPNTTPRAPPALTFTAPPLPAVPDAVEGLTSPDTPHDAFHMVPTAHQPLGSPFGPYSQEYAQGRPQTSANSLLSKHSEGTKVPVSPQETETTEHLSPTKATHDVHGSSDYRPHTAGTFGPPGSRNGSRPGTSGSTGYMSSSRIGTVGSTRQGSADSTRHGTSGSSRLGTTHSSGWGSKLHVSKMDPAIEPYGQLDVGGHVTSPFAFDINNPPPLSGRENLNQSAYKHNDGVETIHMPELDYTGAPPPEGWVPEYTPPATATSTNVEPSSSAQYLPYGHADSEYERYGHDLSDRDLPHGSMRYRPGTSNGHALPPGATHAAHMYSRDGRLTASSSTEDWDAKNGNGRAPFNHAISPIPEEYHSPNGNGMSPAMMSDKFSSRTMEVDSDDTYSDDDSAMTTTTRSRDRRSRNARRIRRATAQSNVTGISEVSSSMDMDFGGDDVPRPPKPVTAQHTYEDDDSPFAEVRASVSNLDDPTMHVLTFRAIFLGLLLSSLACAANTFFLFRNPSPHIPFLVIQVIAYPLGKLLAKILPMREWTVPSWLGGWSFDLNPCTFNIKEHTIIVMMSSVGILPAYGLYTIVTSQVWYSKAFNIGFQIMYILTTQLTGFSMAGLTRNYVIRPASMIWPGVLVTTTLLNTLHAEPDRGTRRVSRLRFFVYATIAAFVWYFVPGFLFKGLSFFSYAAWIAPKNEVVNALFGVRTGLGMGLFTFDWSQIAWIGSPLTSPFWAQMNVGIGFFLFYWFLVPIMHFKNVWYTAYLPISAIEPADRFQEVYDVAKIVNAADQTLNTTAYHEYSPIYITTSFNMTYMLAFALTTALIVHTALNHGPRIWRTYRGIDTEPDDIHIRLMRPFKEVPNKWYFIAFIACFVLGVLTLELFSTGLPVWGYMVAVTMSLVYLIPTGIMFAMTNLEPAFNLIAELIPGYAFPGRPIPGMIFKTFAVQTLTESMYFMRDMKLGHYMKIPPRAMFIAQFLACFVSCFVQIGVKTWMFATIPDMCAEDQSAMLVCQNAQTVFTSSVVWGLIGPARLFSKGGIYNPQLYMLLVGALAPFPFWLWCRKYPRSALRHVNTAVIFSVCLFTPPATGINIVSFLIVGFTFMFWIRRHKFNWWSRYNYVLSAALDVGTLSCSIFIFLVFWLTRTEVNWWGNKVYMKTLDWVGAAARTLEGEYFGPSEWK